MSNRAEQLRRRAAECLELSRKAIDPEVRPGLIIMAQKLYELAKSNRPTSMMTGTERLNSPKIST
jgi:hypothetical protein